MAKFLNKKEQVYDLKLTSYGHYLLSVGKFKPVYYEFFDDNVIYDARYRNASRAGYTGSTERQNEVHKRIKEDTQYLESLVLFEEVENNISVLETDESPTQVSPRVDKFGANQGIGDAFLDGGVQTAPAWKIVSLQGTISSSEIPKGRTNTLSAVAHQNTTIPQINIDLKYIKKIIDPVFNINPDVIQDISLETLSFSDGKKIKLVLDDALIYAEEANTLMLSENYDIEVFAIEPELTAQPASGSMILLSQPEADSVVTMGDGVSLVTLTFKSSASTATEVAIGGSLAVTVSNLKTKIENNLDMNVDYNPDDTGNTTLLLKSKYTGPLGNISIYRSEDAGTDTDPYTGATTNLEIEGMKGGSDAKVKLDRKYFLEETHQIVNGIMKTPIKPIVFATNMHTGSVEYYFNILADQEIREDIACKGAEVFNKESYYVDLDFDCDTKTIEAIYNDIYGRVTEPEICED